MDSTYFLKIKIVYEIIKTLKIFVIQDSHRVQYLFWYCFYKKYLNLYRIVRFYFCGK